jgi:hypothetical protein
MNAGTTDVNAVVLIGTSSSTDNHNDIEKIVVTLLIPSKQSTLIFVTIDIMV